MIDPITICTATASLVLAIVKNGKELAAIYGKFHHAQRHIFLMQTECTILAAALSQIEVLFSSERTKARNYPDTLFAALDQALVACTLTFSVLSAEIEKLTEDGDPEPVQGNMKKVKRARYVWNEDSMTELLGQLRAQSAAMGFLLQAFDASTMQEILRIVDKGTPTFFAMTKSAEVARQSSPPQQRQLTSIKEYAQYQGMEIRPSNIQNRAASALTQFSRVISTPVEPLVALGREQAPEARMNDGQDTLVYRFHKDGLKGPLGQGDAAKANQEGNQFPTYIQYPQPADVVLPPLIHPPPYQPSHLPNAYFPHPKPLESIEVPIAPNPPFVNPSLPPCQPMQTLELSSPSSFSPSSFDPEPWLLNTPAKFASSLSSLRLSRNIPYLTVGIATPQTTRFEISGIRKTTHPNLEATREDKLNIGPFASLVTKVMLAILIERGALSWTTTLADALPRFVPNINAEHHKTTIEMLCSNASGIKTPISRLEGGKVSWYLEQKHVNGRQGRRAAALAMLKRPPDAAPGKEWAEYPGNMMLVAFVIEEKTGKAIEELLRPQVWDRLGMTATGLGLAEPGTARTGHTATAATEAAILVKQPNSDPPPQNPWPHSGREKDTKTNQIQPLDLNVLTNSYPPARRPGREMYASMPDLLKLLQFYLRGIRGLPTPLLTAGSFQHFIKPVLPGSNHTVGWWQVAERPWTGGKAYFWQTSYLGWTAHAIVAPGKGEEGLVVVAVANVTGADASLAAREGMDLGVRWADEMGLLQTQTKEKT